MEHLAGFDADRKNERLDQHAAKPSAFAAVDGWHEGTIKIRMPHERVCHESKEAAPELEISGMFYCPLLEVARAACQDAPSKAFHWMPFKLFHCPKTKSSTAASAAAPDEQLYGDVYTTNAMVTEHEKIQVKARKDREPGDAPEMEYIAVPLQAASDSTHLTNFGSVALWPIYVFFLSLSKYICSCPTSFSAHHLTYIPSVCLA